MTEKSESNGSRYYSVNLNKASGTENEWPHIDFSTYEYMEGHTYRIHFKIRVNSISNMYLEL